jgi:CheB methylesterase
VVLSGALNDGTAGLQAVKQRGGVAVVQDPGDAHFSGMPESALEYVGADHCLPMEKIAPLLVRLSGEPAKEEGVYPVPDDLELESRIAGLDPTAIDSDERPGELSRFTCPECSGRCTRSRAATSCGSGAGWGTPSPPKACSTISMTRWRRRCTLRSTRSKRER